MTTLALVRDHQKTDHLLSDFSHLVMFLCLCGTEEKQRNVKRRISRAKKQGLWSLLIWWSCDGAIQNSSRCSRTFFPSIWPFTAQPELLLRGTNGHLSCSSEDHLSLIWCQPGPLWKSTKLSMNALCGFFQFRQCRRCPALCSEAK